jgi:hypothetical protein
MSMSFWKIMCPYTAYVTRQLVRNTPCPLKIPPLLNASTAATEWWWLRSLFAILWKFVNLMEGNTELPLKLLTSDEPNFYLQGFVNKQNYQYWSDINPRQLHESPLLSLKAVVGCSVGSVGVIRPCFLKIKMDTRCHLRMLTTELRQRWLEEIWFQQNHATAQTA